MALARPVGRLVGETFSDSRFRTHPSRAVIPGKFSFSGVSSFGFVRNFFGENIIAKYLELGESQFFLTVI